MRVTSLGTAEGHTSICRDHSGLLVNASESTLLLDCGAAVPRFLRANELDPDTPEIIWISHMHSDHVGQFSMLIQSLWLRSRQTPLHVFGPGRALQVLRNWLVDCILFPGLIGFPIHWHPVKPGRKYAFGPFVLTPFPTRHLSSLTHYFRKDHPHTCFDCYGVIFEYRKERFVYSADLGSPKDLRPVLRRPVTHLFCELSHFPQEELFRELASSPVRNLWITHYPDALMGKEAKLRAIARAHEFKGRVRLMKDGATCKL